MNENSFTIKTPDTAEIIADAEKAEAPEEEVLADDSQEKAEEKEEDDEKEEKEEEEDDTAGEVPMLDKDFDEGEDVELEVPAEDKFTNDLDKK